MIREHEKTDADRSKETWYEYWCPDGIIPSFPITELDLGLNSRKFKTGTIIKLYDYQFPSGYSAFAQDLNQSINEHLFEPALPLLTVDTAVRYPNNKVLVTDLFGLRKRLWKEEHEYLEDKFSIDFDDERIGKMKVSCFVFKGRVKDYNVKETRDIIRRRYFKNNMSVLFSMNGQVQGHFTSEFISRSLKMNLLKNHLLIHVDCTDMNYNFRKDMFMASRDRLKDGKETQYLRQFLTKHLGGPSSRLAEIEKRRKNAVDIDTATSTRQLLKDFTRKMPLTPEMQQLFKNALNLDLKSNRKGKDGQPNKPKGKPAPEPFLGKHFPSYFKTKVKQNGEQPVVKIPVNGNKQIRFETDVENDYFDRIEEPGELQIAIVNPAPNDIKGGTAPGTPKQITDVFNVNKSSPKDGTIRLSLHPKTGVLDVGDSVPVKVTLTAPGADHEELIHVLVSEPEAPKQPKPKPEDEAPLGMPDLVFAYQDKTDKPEAVDWEDVETATSDTMDIHTVMIPLSKGDELEKVFVNMDSSVLKDFKSGYKNPTADQLELANRKYYTAVYFHTLFLYTITKNSKYTVYQEAEGLEQPEPKELSEYLKDLFDNYYSTFLLNFGGMEEMMQGLGE